MSTTLTLPIVAPSLRRREQWAALAMLAALLLNMLLAAVPPTLVQPWTTPVSAPAASESASTVEPLPPAPTSWLPAELQDKPEVTALRSAYTAAYNLGNGEIAQVMSQTPLHYQDADGAWQPINPFFRKLGGRWLNTTNSVRLDVEERASAARIAGDGVAVTWRPQALEVTDIHGASAALSSLRSYGDRQPATRSADGQTVRFTASWEADIQDQWQSAPGSVEYTLRLAARPQRWFWQPQPESLDLRVNLVLHDGAKLIVDGEEISAADLTSPLATRNPLLFVGSNGQEMLLDAPSTYEQDDPTVRVAGEYVLRATDQPDVIELRVRTPWAWLAAEERRYPVIIDPIFQMRGPTEAWLTHFAVDNLATPDAVTPSDNRIWVGRDRIGLWRGVVRFQIPRMPEGTVVDRAWLYAQPTGFFLAENNPAVAQNGLSTKLALHAITDSAWLGGWSSGTPLNYNPDPIDPDEQAVTFVESTAPATGVRWDVTSQVSQWMVTAPNAPDVANHGLLLRSTQETCAPTLLPNSNIQNPFCGVVMFDVHKSNWSDLDLRNTQDSDDSNNPSFLPSTAGGLRLVVFYRNDNLLTLNQVKAFDLPGGGGTPPASDPYYAADHLYKLPPFDDTMWQALVVRGLGQPQGQYPPPGDGFTYMRPLQGQLDVALMSQNDKLKLRGVTTAPNGVGYILFNGAGAPASAFDQPTLVRVGGVAGAQPSAYDIRLHPQQSTINTILTGNEPKVGPQTLPFSFDSANPLGLWNLTMPLGSNSRVKIRIHTDSTWDDAFLKQYAKHFTARLVRSDAQSDLLGDRGVDEEVAFMDIVQNPATGEAFLTSPIFPVQAGKWALALSYNGPQIESWTVPDCQDEVCSKPPSQRTPIKYGMDISVHSCKDGEFPTSNGQCQQIVCPTAAWPANAPGLTAYDESNGMALWSEAGWNVSGATWTSRGSAFSAPLLGPPASGGNRQPPRVAVIGGVATVNKGVNPNAIAFDAMSDVLLITCGAVNGSQPKPSAYFHAYSGAMSFLGQTAGGPAFVKQGSINGNLVNPWPQADVLAGDITSLTPWLYPVAGLYEVTANVRRITGMSTPATLTFAAKWAVNVGGWASLTRSLALTQGAQVEKIASLAVGLGASFTLDTPAAAAGQSGVISPRVFAGIRAEQAFVVQDARLGGASKPVKAVILPRGVPVPSEPTQVACPASCIDLRAPTEIYPQLNRVWEMPDVHTDVQPGTVAFSSAGAMSVASVDHPALVNGENAANGFAQSFSFDAYKATVSVTSEPCEQGGAPVLVIRGETRIAMPNIGSTADPNAGITANFKLCEAPPDGVGLRSVVLQFESPVGLPIGASGLFLKALGGSVTIRPEGTRIEVNVAFQTEPTGPGGILRATGTVIIDTQGLFAFKGNARLLGVFSADGSLWVAWNPLDIGFEITGGYEDWLTGTVRAHMWRGRGWNNYSWLPDNNDMHFTAAIEATIQIPEGALVDWGPVVIPPTDIGFSVALEFGEFCTNSSCTSYEWGIKGSFTILGYEAGLYYGFDEGLDFILGNDDHILIDQYGGAQSSPVLAAEADMSDIVPVQIAPAAVNGVTLIPFTVSPNAENILVSLGWQAGSPTLSLIDPDGVEITAQNAAGFQGQLYSGASSVIFGVQSPKPGAWQAKVANLSAEGVEHFKFVYLANKGQPGAPGNRGALLLPATPNEQPVNGLYTITWSVPADMTDQATVALYYRRTDVITGNLQIDAPIVRNLPAKTGSYAWDTRKMLAGAYQIKAVIDDGVNELPAGKVSIPDDACLAVTSGLPRQRAFDASRFPGVVTLTAPGTVRIVDNTAPDAPTGLAVVAVDGAIMVRWNPSAAPDVYAYQVQWGPFSPINPLGFEPRNQALVTVGNELLYRIGAVFNGNNYGVNVTALDINGNVSAPTAAVYATPVAGGNPVPLAPVNLAPSGRTAESASFVWQAGAGPAPAGYRLTYTRLGAQLETKTLDVAAVTNATIGGLTLGATYEVRVAALNAQGWQSARSEAVKVLITSGGDANGDDIADDWTALYGVTNKAADSDGDGLSDGDEYFRYTDPTVQDSDGDGLSDGEEVAAATDPLDSSSFAMPTLPRLALAEKRLRFLVKQQPGGEAAPQSVQWANVGGGALSLVASSASPWLLTNVAGDQVQVAVNAAGLAPGFYSGVVRLDAAPGSAPLIGAARCIRVNTWVLPADNDAPQQAMQMLYLPVVSR